MDNYDTKKEQFINDLFEHQFVFEVTKSCGFSVWIPVYKNMTLSCLYENVINYFEMYKEKIILSVSNPDGENLIIPSNTTQTIKEFIQINKLFFKAIYNLPAKIVYKVGLEY
jgi:hypothetical protein